VAYFFDGLPASGTQRIANATLAADAFLSRETAEFVEAYYRITDPKLRRALARLIRVMSEASS
jgi:hypothetical protein